MLKSLSDAHEERRGTHSAKIASGSNLRAAPAPTLIVCVVARLATWGSASAEDTRVRNRGEKASIVKTFVVDLGLTVEVVLQCAISRRVHPVTTSALTIASQLRWARADKDGARGAGEGRRGKGQEMASLA